MTTQTATQVHASLPDNIKAASQIPHGSVTTKLNFFDPPSDGSKPHNYVESPPAGQPQRNYGDKEVEVTINDARGREQDFNLDVNAFATLTGIHGEEPDWSSDESIKSVYYPQVEQLLLQHAPGKPQRVLLFDHTIRRADPAASRNPVTRVHIDQTSSSGPQRVHVHLPEEAETLLKGRVRIINVWRPLNGPVESFPLAFADSTTIPDEALVPVQHRYPHRTGETAAVSKTDGQEWWYWSGIDNSERILLQCYDTETGSRVPHTAFIDPRRDVAHSPGVKPRESIEVRALVFG